MTNPCLPSDLQGQPDPGAAEQLQADLAAAVEAEAEKDKEVRALGTLIKVLSCLQCSCWACLQWLAALVVLPVWTVP